MTKVQPNSLQRFWQSQKKPIFFFGFLIVAIGLGMFSNYNNTLIAKRWSNQVASEIVVMETSANNLLKQTTTASKQSEIGNLLKVIETNSKIANSQDDQIVAKSYNLKTYYASYLETGKKNLVKIQSNLKTATELEVEDNWDIRLVAELKKSNTQPNKSKILQEYQSGKILITKLEEYNKQSTDTVIIGKLVTAINYYKGVISYLDGVSWLQDGAAAMPSSEQLSSQIIELEKLIKPSKPVAELFSQITTGSYYTGELINTKNNVVKIIKKVNE